jgi:hypothetical protein
VGFFVFKDFYQFCYDWLTEQTGIGNLSEAGYSEKIVSDSKNIDIEWKGSKKITDYFRGVYGIKFKIMGMKDAEAQKGDMKISGNKGEVKISVKGILERDWQGKFEESGFQKFIRSIYEKWVIPQRVDKMEDVVVGDCDEFVSQAKAFLSLEGQK